MIRYALDCGGCGQSFEGWFKNAASCDAQLASGAVSCPFCGSVSVAKGLMAPAVGAGSATQAPEQPPASSTPKNAPEERRYVAHPMRALEERLRALRAHVEANAEPVGADFAKEARAIHEGEAEERAIYGEATPEEAEALRDDGVPVAPIPWIDRRDD